MQTRGLWLFFTVLCSRKEANEVNRRGLPWVEVIKKEEVSEFTT